MGELNLVSTSESKIFRITGSYSDLPREQFWDTVYRLRSSSACYAWAGESPGGLSREQLSMIMGCDIPVFVADPESVDRVSQIACSSGRINWFGHSFSSDESFALAEKCLPYISDPGIKLCFSHCLGDLLKNAASPIEARLAIYLADAFDMVCNIESQAPIPVNGKNYRADFVLSEEGSQLKMVIEADGHDFHERTKEQAAKDKSRDRAMLAEGYKVMRFTGSEIHNKARECAAEVRRFWEANS